MPEEKKIIVDEDWKSQVLAEKESLQRETNQPPADGGDSGKAGSEPEMPPASWEMLLSTLATEALVALGQVPHPATGEQHYFPQQAKYFIDTLDILRTKTEGNLSTTEKEAIESLLHQLRMAFVAGPPPTAGPTGSAGPTPAGPAAAGGS